MQEFTDFLPKKKKKKIIKLCYEQLTENVASLVQLYMFIILNIGISTNIF